MGALIITYNSVFDTVPLQITSPRFPVVVKMGHAHSGMGKVRLDCSRVCPSQCEHSVSVTDQCQHINIWTIATSGESGQSI